MTKITTLTQAEKKAEFCHRTSCIVCGSHQLRTLWESSFEDEKVRAVLKKGNYSGDPLSALQDTPFKRLQCQDCTMSFQSDILTDEWLNVLYGEWISSEQIATTDRAHGFSPTFKGQQDIKHCLRLHKLLNTQSSRSPRLLDFGCGDGRFLKAANLFGFKSFGVDFSDSRQSRSRQLGAITLYSTLEDLQRSRSLEEGFNVVTLFQVLEHLADPLQTLKN